MLAVNPMNSGMKETYQNLILQHKPHYFQERLAPANGKNIGTIDPLPVLDSTGVCATFVRRLLAGRDSGDRGRSVTGLGLGSIDPQSADGVGAETSQETLDSTDGLEGLESLEVDEGGEAVRLEDKRGGINGLDLVLLLLRAAGVDGRARVGWCGRAEGMTGTGESDGGDHVRGRVKRMITMMDCECGIISSGRRIRQSSGIRVVSGVE